MSIDVDYFHRKYGLNVMDVEYKQRAYDGKWELLAQIMDTDNQYTYETDSGGTVFLIPTRWLTLAVYDLQMEFVD